VEPGRPLGTTGTDWPPGAIGRGNDLQLPAAFDDPRHIRGTSFLPSR
jgi:hypothetical protein